MGKTIKHKIIYVTCAVAAGLLSSIIAAPISAAEPAPAAHAAESAKNQKPASVYIEDLTSPEVSDLIKSGYNIIIIPTGGTEQNLAHMVLGKHNKIVNYTAGEIANELGNALVAPVIAYVPEGNISPPEGHMQYAGTVSLREESFSALLEDTAASFKQHGFKLICFLGEHGGNQKVQQQLADVLTAKWKADGVRVLQVSDYYAENGQDGWVKTLKLPLKDPAAHAGFEDSSELMAVDGQGVRKALASGDASFATVGYGKKLLDLKIKTAVKQIKYATQPKN